MVHGPMFSDFSTLMQIPCALITGNGPRTMSRITSEARTQHSGNVLYRYGSSICMGAGTEKLKTIIIALNIHTPFFFFRGSWVSYNGSWSNDKYLKLFMSNTIFRCTSDSGALDFPHRNWAGGRWFNRV